MNKSFEKELPSGYKEAFHINATDKKIGLILNGIALLVMLLVMGVAAIPLVISGKEISFAFDFGELMIAYAIFFGAMLLYIVLHELTHGAVYKLLTKEKLTYGISWSCAFCGVPHIYVYRKTALAALVAPLILFTVILIPVTVILYYVNPIYYLASAFIFGLHLGGCSGDAYITILLIFKYKTKSLLMKDTGPEQYIYELTEQEC